ncbi:MAG: T9SS type A sorting domain-containing protein [Bacteroidia bacterium]|nr:T9SS type A sorting domain-containing protein [Bacteroidia bacterium]
MLRFSITFSLLISAHFLLAQGIEGEANDGPALRVFTNLISRYAPPLILAHNESSDTLDFVLRNENKSTYAIYLPNGGSTQLEEIRGFNNTIRWYNPRNREMGEEGLLKENTLHAPDKNDWLAIVKVGVSIFHIEWLELGLEQTGRHKVRLDWATTFELNNAYFEIERSTDGLTFEKIAQIPGAGNSDNPRHYTYIDAGAREEFFYYRLSQKDLKGNYVHSDLLSLNLDKSLSPEIQLYPSPVRDLVHISLDEEKGKMFQLTVMDLQGSTIFSQEFEIKAQDTTLYTGSLTPGQYMMTLKDQNREYQISKAFQKE